MRKNTALHAVLLILVLIFIFYWTNESFLSGYSLQLTAFLLLVLIITRRMVKPTTFRVVESLVSTAAVLLVVSASGGISSPLFFLNYFLLFELSFLLEPAVPLFLSAGLIFFYLSTGQVQESTIRLMELLAFPFMTPLAYLFGKLYQKEENQKKEIRNLSKKVEELEEELVEEEIKISQ